MTWVQEIQAQINDVFDLKIEDGPDKGKDNPDSEFEVRNEHLNAKFFNTNRYFETIAEILERRYKNSKKIDLIMASDDQAVFFLYKYRDRIFSHPKIPVVFCGVNSPFATAKTNKIIAAGESGRKEDQDSEGNSEFIPEPLDREKYKEANFTGFLEKTGIYETLNLIAESQGGDVEVFVINDDLETTGRSWRAELLEAKQKIQAEAKYPKLQITPNDPENSLQQLKSKIEALGRSEKKKVILLGAYFSDKNRTIETYEKTTAAICEAATRKDGSKIPVFGMLGFHLANGAWGGYQLSGTGEGQKMAELAKQILVDKKNAAEINVSPRGQYAQPHFNYQNIPRQDRDSLWNAIERIKLASQTEKHKDQNSEDEYITRESVGLAPPNPIEKFKDLYKEPAWRKYFNLAGAFLLWYALISLLVWRFNRLAFWLYCKFSFAENLPLSDSFSKVIGYTSSFIREILLLPFLLMRHWLMKEWLRNNSKHGLKEFRKNEKVRTTFLHGPLAVPFTLQDESQKDVGHSSFSTDLFRKLFSVGQHTRLLIFGRGGVGKSTLSLQIAEAALKGEISDTPMIPILILGPDQDPTKISDTTNEVLKLFGNSESFLPRSWVKYLAEKGALLWIFDGWSEMPAHFANRIITGGTIFESPMNRMILTSRSYPKTSFMRRREQARWRKP